MPDILLSTLLSLSAFVVVLSVVVFVHEFGHFQVGRWCGVAVKSFSIGLGPEWFGWTDKHGTRWKISSIPLGGFVSWVDDVDATSTLPNKEAEALSQAEQRRRGYFRAMEIWKRAAATAAGPLSNFVFSIFAFGLIAFIVGRDLTDYSAVRAHIAGVEAGSPADLAGLRAGEMVEAVNGAQVRGNADFQALVARNAGNPLELQLITGDGATRTLTVTPRTTATGQGQLGVSLRTREEDRIIQPIGPIEAIGFGAGNTWSVVARTADYVAGIFQGRNSGQDIAGPIGIYTVSGQVASASLAGQDGTPWTEKLGTLALSLLGLAAMLSVAVGIVNLLPIPLLDGGHLLFYAIEALRGGKPLPPAAHEWAFKAGLAVMGSLFLFATWNDITRLLPGNNG